MTTLIPKVYLIASLLESCSTTRQSIGLAGKIRFMCRNSQKQISDKLTKLLNENREKIERRELQPEFILTAFNLSDEYKECIVAIDNKKFYAIIDEMLRLL
jgi:hypothetical protein